MINFLFERTPIKFFAQSFWRDEAFTYLLSKQSIISMLVYTAKDYNPPLYYLIVHFWMMIFGSSEIALRLFSLISYCGIIYVAHLILINILEIPTRRSYVYLLVFFCNPALVYYAYEARMYTMFAFLATASFYTLYTKNRKWYLITTTLGLYSHYFMVLVVASQWLYIILTSLKSKDLMARLKDMTIPFLLFAPWVLFVIFQFQGYSKGFWIMPPKLSDILYVPASLYTAYEVVYGFFPLNKAGYAPFVIALSAVITGIVAFGITKAMKDRTKTKKAAFMFICWSLVPGLLMFIVSFYKPLFLPRYLLFTTPGLLLLILYAIDRMPRAAGLIVMTVLLGMTLYFQQMQIKHYTKADLGRTIREIRAMASKNDVIYVTDELRFQVAQYYFGDDHVYIYNKKYEDIPWYIGKVLIPQNRVTTSLPIFPVKAFILTDDTHYEIRSIR